MTEYKKPMLDNEKSTVENDVKLLISVLKKKMNPTADKAFSARIEREIRRLLNNKQIQGIYESMGDKIINEYVDGKYPYGEGNPRNDKLNTLLKSNWFLNIMYKRIKLPLPPERFINEKVYRYSKRGASLFEWYVGLYFLGTGGNIPARTEIIKANLHKYFDNIFSDIATESESGKRELEIVWYEFQCHRADIRAQAGSEE